MRIEGFIVREGCRPMIRASWSYKGSKFYPILFVVDTSHWDTTLGEIEIYRADMDIKDLEPWDRLSIDFFRLKDMTIKFINQEGEESENKLDVRVKKGLYTNWLGRDILSRYKLTYAKEEIYLER